MLPYKVHRGRKSAHDAASPPFPAQQLFVLGMHVLCDRDSFSRYIEGLRQTRERDYTDKFLTPSFVPNLRADCLHVYFPLQLLHGSVLQDHSR